MSDSGDTMGSLLDSGPVVEPPDDPEDLEAPRVAIDTVSYTHLTLPTILLV